MPNYSLKKRPDLKAEAFEDQKPDYEARLDYYDRAKNNNKFWHIQVFGTIVVRRYGRNGYRGQSLVEEAPSAFAAKNFAKDMEDEKRKSGYQTDPSLLEKIAREAVED